jgi:hypothetical protein
VGGVAVTVTIAGAAAGAAAGAVEGAVEGAAAGAGTGSLVARGNAASGVRGKAAETAVPGVATAAGTLFPAVRIPSERFCDGDSTGASAAALSVTPPTAVAGEPGSPPPQAASISAISPAHCRAGRRRIRRPV